MSFNCPKSNTGHNFLYPNSSCTHCSINQYDLNKKEKKIDKSYSVGKDKGKSPRGVLFNDIINFFKIKDKKKFYWTTFQHYTNTEIYSTLSTMKDKFNRGEVKGTGIGLFIYILKANKQ